MDRARPNIPGAAPPSSPVHAAPTDAIAVGVVVAALVVARFVAASPLWLDEALSVNIASLPLGDLPDALRQDGHPPLYYALLHVWMDVVGTSDTAIRALSGLLSVAALPLAYVAGRRRAGPAGGLGVLLVTAVLPWGLRYATEARMYALEFLLVLAAWLLADDLLRRPSRLRWAGLAALTAAALLTHYWTLYLGMAAVGILAGAVLRGHLDRRAAVRVGSALAVGAVGFVPWLGVFLYQAGHTGTPWATATRPTVAFVELLRGIGGVGVDEGLLVGVVVVLLAAVGLLAHPTGAEELRVDLRTVGGVRPEVLVAAGTFVLGVGIGLVTSSVFVARYAAAFLPMLVIAAGVGLARLPGPWTRRAAAVALVGLAAVPVAINGTEDRTQGAELASAIDAGASPDDVVAVCPDQLGPATLRSLSADVTVVGLPALERPDRIDWVDYADRNQAAVPAETAERLLDAAGDGAIWLVLNAGYRTYEGYCDGVLAALQGVRGPGTVVVPDRPDVFEHGTLVRLDP